MKTKSKIKSELSTNVAKFPDKQNLKTVPVLTVNYLKKFFHN